MTPTGSKTNPALPNRLPRLWAAQPGQRHGVLCPGKCLNTACEEASPHPGWSPQRLPALPDSLPEEKEHNRIHAAWDPTAPSKDARGS